MTKVVHVAIREFISTAATKGFILGILVTPLLIGLLLILMPLLINRKAPKIDGEVAIVDPTGVVAPALAEYLAPEEIARRRGQLQQEIQQKIDEQIPVAGLPGPSAAQEAMRAEILGQVPELHVVPLPPDADVEREKEPLRDEELAGRLALVVVEPNAIEPAPGEHELGSYWLYVKGKLDDRIQDEIRRGVREAIIAARLQRAGLDPEEMERLTRVERRRAVAVTAAGERESNEVINLMIPMAFMLLLFMSVFTSGQYLLTTTVEEKSSRVVELILSAVSPMQLMTGKIIGQMMVGLVIMLLYAGMGIAALIQFASLGLVDASLFAYLMVFYVLAYFTIAAFMAAIGAAVNEMREAQTLMTPIVLIVMIPWMLWMPISRDPNSTFATVLSFLPPVNSFVMLLRLSTPTPPPLWQVLVSIAVAAAAAYASVWFAAKVFRIGLLMFGKPPSFRTLVRWVRMA